LNPTNPGSNPGVHICRDTLLTPQLGEQVAIAHLAPRRRAEPQCHVSYHTVGISIPDLKNAQVRGFKAIILFHPIRKITQDREKSV
jgi:hypothetical protein